MIMLNRQNQTALKLGSKSLCAVTVNGKLVFPNDLFGALVVLDLSGLSDDEARRLQYALATVGKATEARFCDADLPNGRVVALNSQHDELPNVLMVGDSLCFLPSQVELAQDVAVGDVVSVRIQLPGTYVRLGRWEERDVSYVEGMTFRSCNHKGQKKVCANADFWVFSIPSGEQIFHNNDFREGHKRGDYWQHYGSIKPKKGDKDLRARVRTWGGNGGELYFDYPAITLSLSLPILDNQTYEND